jgi:protein-disulfide isomerase
MRYVVLLLAAAFFGFAPLTAHAASEPANADAPSATSTPAAAAVTPKAFSDAERAGIESIIQDFLINKHPEVLMEAMKELQRRDQANAEEKSKTAISSSKDKIYNDPNSPVGGNPKGEVVMVEFYDYQCGYCKMSEEAVEKVIKENKDVKFIYKDFPILGPMSVQASKASFASTRQGNAKFIKFHDLMMGKKDHLSDDIIYQTAKEAGLDVDKLKKDMASDDVDKMIKANLELGNAIGVRGTPMFIVGQQIFPGALQYDQLKKAVEDARAKK